MTADIELLWEKSEVRLEGDSNCVSGLESLADLKGRYVYAIETPREMAIRYESGISNVCYIGRQGDRSRGNRLLAHGKSWITRTLVLSRPASPFILHFCHPRRRNMANAYKDIEACLIREFATVFGSKPLFNKKYEREHASHGIVMNSTILRRRSHATAWSIDAQKPISPELEVED